MKRHIKGFNIIRLVLACVIGIGAMNIGLISADDTRLVDEEAVKIEEVMSIGDDVSSISSGLLTEAANGMQETWVTVYSNIMSGGGNFHNASTTYVDIYYNGRLWGQTVSALGSTTSTATDIILYNGAKNTSKPVYTTMHTGSQFGSGFTFNSNGTLTWKPATSSGYTTYMTYISLTGSMEFGGNEMMAEAANGMQETWNTVYSNQMSGGGNFHNASKTYVDIYYNGRLWGQTVSALGSTTSAATDIILYNGAINTSKPVYTAMHTGSQFGSGFTFNSNGTLTWKPATSSGYTTYMTYISLTGSMEFGGNEMMAEAANGMQETWITVYNNIMSGGGNFHNASKTYVDIYYNGRLWVKQFLL